MGGAFREYFSLLDELGRDLERLTEIQQRKTAAVRRDDLMEVSECMKQEQALSLSLRNLEQKRVKMLAHLGLADTKLTALAEKCPAEYRLEARQAAETLQNRYKVYRAAAEVARNTLEVNLHEIGKIVEREGVDPAAPRRRSADFRA